MAKSICGSKYLYNAQKRDTIKCINNFCLFFVVNRNKYKEIYHPDNIYNIFFVLPLILVFAIHVLLETKMKNMNNHRHREINFVCNFFVYPMFTHFPLHIALLIKQFTIFGFIIFAQEGY